MKDLNEKQKEAAITTEGYVRVVAGAGSGKTKTITHRFAYLVNELGVSPNSILCVTFTNKAAKEMRERVENLINQPVGDFICTYHSFCVKFLREEIFHLNLAPNFSVMDESDSLDVLKEIYQELRITPTDKKYSVSKSEIRETKRNYPDYVYYFDDKEQRKPTCWSRLFSAFLTKQRKYNMFDYDDLIYLTLHILNNYSDVVVKWNKRINYVMVDESQDNNNNNWAIAEKLSEINGNLFAVGDPDQSIYGWRGANPQLFADFDKIHPNCKDIILDINYRSLQSILTASDYVVKNNKNRLDKNMTANRNGDTKIIWHHSSSETEEAAWIARKIIKLHDSGNLHKDSAILYRSNHNSRAIESALRKHKIPYVIYGGTRFFERTEIKDTLAYLKLIEFNDDFSFIRAINSPKRGLGEVFIQKLKLEAQKSELYLFDTLYNNIDKDSFKKKGAIFFCKFINECRKMKEMFSISDLVEYILDESGIRKTLKEDGDEERMENLKELVSSIRLYEKEHEGTNISLESYLQDIALYTNMDYKHDGDNLKIMTIHQSKGLEFKNVFIFAVSEGTLPNYRSLRDPHGLEEERRIMYVAMTRARDNLFITDSVGYNSVTNEIKSPSRFIVESVIYEIDKESIPVEIEKQRIMQVYSNSDDITGFKIGDKVKHPVFKGGKIVDITNDGYYIIQFENYGIKNISTNFRKLEFTNKNGH